MAATSTLIVALSTYSVANTLKALRRFVFRSCMGSFTTRSVAHGCGSFPSTVCSHKVYQKLFSFWLMSVDSGSVRPEGDFNSSFGVFAVSGVLRCFMFLAPCPPL